MIKAVQSGFSVLEFLLYFMIMTMIIMFTMDWMVSCQYYVAKTGRMSTRYSALITAHDLIMRDLACARADDAAWKKCTSMSAIWSTRSGDVGWELSKNTLFRREGLYNAERDVWVTVHCYKVADDLKRLTIMHDHVQASCCLEGQGDLACYIVDRCVALHNGIII